MSEVAMERHRIDEKSDVVQRKRVDRRRNAAERRRADTTRKGIEVIGKAAEKNRVDGKGNGTVQVCAETRRKCDVKKRIAMAKG